MNKYDIAILQTVNMDRHTETPSTHISAFCNSPTVYELRRGSEYHGLTSPIVCSPFSNFLTDALYQFPLIDGQASSNELRALISSSLFTVTKGVDLNEIFQALHTNSPFKKTPTYYSIRLLQSSNLFNEDSIGYSGRSSNILNESYQEDSSLSPNTSLGDRSQLDAEAIKMIQQIQREFHSRPENENNLQSLTPVSSILSSCLSQNLSGVDFENPNYYLDEEVLDLPSIDEFCLSLGEEGKIQCIKFVMEFQESASKNILSNFHQKPELIKLSPKSLGSMNSPYTSLVQECSTYHPTSPILRKLVFCENNSKFPDTLEIISSVATTGFGAALSLEYSNVDLQNKACVDYKKSEKLLINNSIAKAISNNKAIWLSCGFEHCALLTCDGKVMTWGYGASGCLGHGDTDSYGFPYIVKSLSMETCKYIECGGYHTLAITDNSEIYTWGRGDVHQLGLPYRQLCKDEHGHVALRPIKLALDKKVKGGACGEAHTLILNEDGTLLACGWGEDGQLGINPNEFDRNNFKGISQINFCFNSPVLKVSAGHIFSACLTEKGEIFIWGNGEKGQFAREIDSEFIFTPQKIEIEKIVDIVCGESNVLCVGESGAVYGWGLGKAGYFSSQSQNFTAGSELVCYSAKLLGEADVIHHYLL